MKRYVKETVVVSPEEHMNEYAKHILELTQAKIDAEKELMDALGKFPTGYTKEVNVQVFPDDPRWDSAFPLFDPVEARGEVNWLERKE